MPCYRYRTLPVGMQMCLFTFTDSNSLVLLTGWEIRRVLLDLSGARRRFWLLGLTGIALILDGFMFVVSINPGNIHSTRQTDPRIQPDWRRGMRRKLLLETARCAVQEEIG